MSALISRFQAHLQGSRSARTARGYLRVARAFVAHLDVAHRAAPTEAAVASFLARLRADGRRRSALTHNHELGALRVLGRFAKINGFWPSDPAGAVPFLRAAARDPAVLSIGELQRFFLAASRDADAARRSRSVAILVLLSQAGLRVHELVTLDVEQVDLASATLVAVRGKGGTVHDVPMSGRAADLIADWLEKRQALASSVGALFVARGGGRLSVRSVQRLLASLRREVGTAKRVTPHTLRHTTATLALTLGADLSTVGDLLRHSDLNTTRRYLHLVDERRRKAVQRLEVTIPREICGSQRGQATPPLHAEDAHENDRKPVDVHDDLDDLDDGEAAA